MTRVEKALEITNKKLANIPSGNTGFKVKYGSLMQTACSGAKFLKRISTFKKEIKVYKEPGWNLEISEKRI